MRICAAAGHSGRVIGDGPELPAWRALARELEAPVTFLGAQPRRDTLAQMKSCSALFLLPRTHADGSGAEGLGLVLLEARAIGLQVVGCATGGVPEALGSDGLLLPDPDDAADSAVRATRSIRHHHLPSSRTARPE